MPENTPDNGVLTRHRERMANDEAYRNAALSINPDAPGGAALGKYLEGDAPTSLAESAAIDSSPVPPSEPGAHMVDQTAASSSTDEAIDQLAGDDLDQAARVADIEGRSSMSADEKRDALRAVGYTP